MTRAERLFYRLAAIEKSFGAIIRLPDGSVDFASYDYDKDALMKQSIDAIEQAFREVSSADCGVKK